MPGVNCRTQRNGTFLVRKDREKDIVPIFAICGKNRNRRFSSYRKNDPYACRPEKAVTFTNRPGKTNRRIHGRTVLQEKGGTSDTMRRMRRPDPLCARKTGPMRFRRGENELPPLSRSLLQAGHAGKDEARHALLGTVHAALLSPDGDRPLARRNLRTMTF